MKTRDDYKVDVPEGRSGDWAVERFEVSEQDAKFEALRAVIGSSRRGVLRPGTYTRLTRRGAVVMSDTPDEVCDHMGAIWHARGDVLINGLGLGVVLGACLAKPEVRHATVVEISKDVIDLVAPHYKARFGGRVTVVLGDAFEVRPAPGVRYAMVWHDVWDDLCEDNLEGMRKLHRRWGRRCDWQGSWGRAFIESRCRG